MNILEIENLSFGYGSFHQRLGDKVLKDINFCIDEGESVGLIGANGVGKSTMLKLLSGLLDMQEGRIRIAGLEMKKENLAQIRAEIGYVFQDSDSQLFMSTVYEDVAFAPRNYGKREETVERLTMRALGKGKRTVRFTVCPEVRRNWRQLPPFLLWRRSSCCWMNRLWH